MHFGVCIWTQIITDLTFRHRKMQSRIRKLESWSWPKIPPLQSWSWLLNNIPNFWFLLFVYNTDIESRDLFQLQKWKAPRIFIFDDTNIDSSCFSDRKYYSFWFRLENIFEFFTMGSPSITSIHRMHFNCNVVCNFHTQPVHTIYCTELATKVSFT